MNSGGGNPQRGSNTQPSNRNRLPLPPGLQQGTSGGEKLCFGKKYLGKVTFSKKYLINSYFSCENKWKRYFFIPGIPCLMKYQMLHLQKVLKKVTFQISIAFRSLLFKKVSTHSFFNFKKFEKVYSYFSNMYEYQIRIAINSLLLKTLLISNCNISGVNRNRFQGSVTSPVNRNRFGARPSPTISGGLSR